MIALREKEFAKLAAMLQIPEDQLRRLHSMRLLDESVAIDVLVKYEFRRLKKTGEYTTKQITEALVREYDISRGKVQNAIYNKRKSRYFCKTCGRSISQYKHLKYGDVCEQCAIESIKI